MDELFQKFKKQFREEILRLLEQLENDLLILENDPGNRVLIDSVFRAMHTIKGTSAMYEFTHISDFTHHFESIYQSIRDANSQVDLAIIDISLKSLDHIKHIIDDEKLLNPENQKRHKELLSLIQNYHVNGIQNNIKNNASDSPSVTPGTDNSIEKLKSWYILIRTDEQIFYRGISLINLLTDLSALGTFHIHRIPALSDKETETWGIVLISEAELIDIKDIFIFIEESCTFSLIKEGDLIKPEENTADIISEIENPIISKAILALNLEKTNFGKSPAMDNKNELIKNLSKSNVKRINVDANKLDYLMYLVSELITLNSQLLLTTKDDRYVLIRPQIEQMESLVKLFRNNALEIRLVPLSDLLLKFQRLIRDLSKQLGKKIEFVTQGTDIELDKNTIDLIADPIIHIIRNCIDHGIEAPGIRLKNGKKETGIIKFSATHVGNYIQLTIEDDGKGLDLEKIKANAIQRGMIKNGDSLSRKELTDLIFTSGLSTAKNITSVSGRGVGMDVVRKTISELRGEISVNSEENKGTSFTLKIQQSLAIIDTLLFRVENTYFIVSLTDIEICIRLDMVELIKHQNTGTLEYREQMIPFADLRSFFNLKGSYGSKIKALIVKVAGTYIALLADEILGEQQAVLKPLGNAFSSDMGIMAVTQHGNGNWAYMLNARFIFDKIRTGAFATDIV